MLEVPEAALLPWLEARRAEGYTLLGLEQTSESHQLPAFDFPRRAVLVLGREREGLPPEVGGVCSCSACSWAACWCPHWRGAAGSRSRAAFQRGSNLAPTAPGPTAGCAPPASFACYLAPQVLQVLDATLEIPQLGVVRSLNVHVSGAIALYEYTRQGLRAQQH
jgi:hypothetical protein